MLQTNIYLLSEKVCIRRDNQFIALLHCGNSSPSRIKNPAVGGASYSYCCFLLLAIINKLVDVYGIEEKVVARIY